MKLPPQIDLSITRFNVKGRGIGSFQEKSVEVVGAIPGDVARVKPFAQRRQSVRADLLEVLTPSEDRTPLRCAHAPLCGGCTFQGMDYGAQLRYKQARVEALFAPLSPLPARPILASPSLWQYRNKMEFSFSQNKAGEKFLGLILAGTRGHVFNVTECHLVSAWMAQVLAPVRAWWEESDLLAYRINDTGALRTLTMREGKNTSDKLVMLTVSGNPAYAIPKATLDRFVTAVLSCFSASEKQQLSIFLRIQQALKGSPTQFFEYHLFGKTHLEETLDLPGGERRFHISPTSFFQPNTAQAEVLYSTALDLVSWPKRHVLDLYAGAATLGMAMAARADKVTSIELNPYACCDAEINKELNGVDNIEIICGDVGKELERLQTPIDLVVIDPPRVGLSAEAHRCLISLKPPEILYISCNPQSQAKDIEALLACGYRLQIVQPVDSFPHTPHIENIALLTLS